MLASLSAAMVIFACVVLAVQTLTAQFPYPQQIW
jgi:hypothetical protein